MERKKVEIQSSDPSALASDRFNFIMVSEMCLSVPRYGWLLLLAWLIRS
jgi:hypothetical protein